MQTIASAARALVLTAAFLLAPPAHAQEPQTNADMKSPIRDVTPSGVIRVYRSNEAPETVDAGLPKFADVQVLQDGALRSDGKTIRLYGIKLPERKKLCMSLFVARWPCGVTAYVALRNLVQSHSIACNILNETEKNIVAQCKVDQTDIALWLLQEGWAELAAGVTEQRYADAAALAKTKSTGLWGNGPPEFSNRSQQ
jgi:endonuclease YncB( thermonuclease family)